MCVACAAPVYGQEAINITGTVLDANRAVVVEAEVMLRTGSQIIARTTTAQDGSFALSVDLSSSPAAPSRSSPASSIISSPNLLTFIVQARGFDTYRQTLDLRDTTPRDATTSTTGIAATNAPLEIILIPATVAEEVIVSATRSPTRLNDTASSVVVLTSDELRTTAAVTLDEQLRQVPGFSLFRRSSSRFANPTAQGVSLRGTGGSGASRALVLADGVPMTDPFGGWIYWGRVPRTSVERVEVLRGAASDLYGSGALGGVISVKTREAKESPALRLETSLGSQTTGDASVWLCARRGSWGATLAAEAFRTDGYVLVSEAERGAVDTKAASSRRSGEVTLQRYFKGDAGNNLSREARLFLRAATYGERRNNGTLLQTNDTRISNFTFGADASQRIVGNFSVRVYGGTQTYDQIFTSIAANRSSETLTRSQRVPAQQFGASAQTAKSFGDRHTIVGGFEWREVRGASDETIYQQGNASSLVGAGGRARTVSFYASDLLRVGNRLILNGGLRFDRWRNYRALAVTRPLNSQIINQTAFDERSETAFSPRVSALFQLNTHVSLVASFARAFRQPTLNELYRDFRVGNILTLANSKLSAERLTGAEAGASFSFFGNRFSTRTVAFYNRITNPVSNVTLNATSSLITRQRQNLGSTVSGGFEAEAEARPTNSLTVSGGYLFVDARVKEFPANRQLEGLALPQVARHQLTLQARYARPSGLTFGIQGRFSSRQFDDDQNLLPLAKFFTIDALASKSLNPYFDLFVAAENLTDSRYEIGRTPVLTVSPPLFLRFGVRLRFGGE